MRDCFRFKVVTHSFEGALRAVECIAGDKHICPKGLTRHSCVKLDLAKLRQPKEWGWRFVALDLVLPNQQLVEVGACALRHSV